MRLERRYGSPDLAERIVRAVAVDDPGSVVIRREEDRIVIEASGENPASVRTTLDDLLACLGAAERTLRLTRRPAR